MVHQLHDAQFGTFKEFLACFVKPEVLAPSSPKLINRLNLDKDTDQFLKLTNMFIGAEVEKLIKEVGKKDLDEEKF